MSKSFYPEWTRWLLMINSYYSCTLGCKVNSYETAATCAQFSSLGAVSTSDATKADLIIVNTCSVTSKAGQKSRQHISSLRKKNPDAVLLVMGCYSQTHGEEVAGLGADIVLGASSRSKAVEYVTSFLQDQKPIIDVKPSLRKEGYEELGETAYCETCRAYLKVQDGCDAFCSYCYIPILRGNSRSRDPRSVVEEAMRLVEKGYKEIVITGIHTGMYGKDLPGEYRLSNLLQSILMKCPGLLRLRISSLEENEIDGAFLALLRREKRLVSHLHIPLQSGSASVLRDMGRHYDTDAFLEKLRLIREVRPDIAITTDVIVGYPTETEEHFKQTLAFCEAAGFAEIHVFPFSSRPHTRAATLKDLSPEIKKDRVHRLLALSKKLRSDYEARFYGKQVEVLVEEEVGEGYVCGHTPNYLLVRFKGDESMRNTLQFVTYDSSVASD